MSNSTANRKIALGADHAGFELKEHLKSYLRQRGHQVVDCGTHSRESVDYPEFAVAVAQRVADRSCWRGIMIDGAGIGSAIVANKIAGVRAAACYDASTARNSREHNDANVLTLGAGLVGQSLAEQILDVWLAGECTADRHRRRVAMIEQIERGGQPSPPVSAAAASSPPDADTGALAGVEGLSEEDLQRILARMAELGAAGGSPAWAKLARTFCQICAESDPKLVRQLIDAGAERIGQRPGQGLLPAELAKYIDHTLLRPEATVDEVKKLCAEATEHGFASVCVNPSYVQLAVRELAGSSVNVCTVAGFPLGGHLPEIKAMEARRAIREGAREIDMVINVGALKSGDHDLVYRDILGVTDACSERAGVCKVIIEAALLTDDEKITACQLAKKARADFVKTSTGFGPRGATVHDVALMRDAVGDSSIGVKAAGGIRTLEDARRMIEAGAARIGTSTGVKILKEAKEAQRVPADPARGRPRLQRE